MSTANMDLYQTDIQWRWDPTNEIHDVGTVEALDPAIYGDQIDALLNAGAIHKLSQTPQSIQQQGPIKAEHAADSVIETPAPIVETIEPTAPDEPASDDVKG